MPDVKPPAKLRLRDYPVCYLLTWETATGAHTRLLFVSNDGLRCALLDPVETLVDLWKRLSKSPGPAQKSDAKPKSVRQRERRAEKAKSAA